jgi:hypothetical protein
MPKFEFNTPSGKFELEGPEGFDQEKAIQKFKQMKPELFSAPAAQPQAKEEPVYDPMGSYTGVTAPSDPYAAPSKQTYSETLTSLGKVGRGAAVGGVSALPGAVGDIESLGRSGLRLAGADVSEKTFAPTTEEISKGARKFLGWKPSAEEEIGSTFGSLIGGFFGPGEYARGLKAISESKVIGRPGIQAARAAEAAEKEGIQVAAKQVREMEPKGKELSPAEQFKVNEAVTAETGEKTNSISPEFIKGRLNKLGEKYNEIYSGEFQIDENIAKIVENIARTEAQLGAAGSSDVASIASNISNRYKKAVQEAEAMAQQQTMMKIMSGQQTAFKRGKGEFVEKTFGPGERIDASPLTKELLQSYGASDHVNVRPITAADAPAWAKDVNSLITELTDKLGLRVNPGVYVGSNKGSYGWAHPYGHIFLNESLLKNSKDAVATALHEFGHMVEFQLFDQASKETKTAINQAWNESKIAGKGKTVEQLRPITSEKYGEWHAKEVPSTAKDKEYYLGFKEWFAEQASRWLTSTKEPIGLAEKFFKGIADTWKTIYAKVVGHLPMADATQKFMRENWKGKLINETITKRIFQMPEGSVVAAKDTPAKSTILTEPVIAQIEGKDLQRLRSYISEKAANSSDGMVRHQARQVLNQIDSLIEKTNPKAAASLKDTNHKYRATMALREMEMAKDPSLLRGNINPETLGKLTAGEGSRLSHPLSKWGEFGNVLNMRATNLSPVSEPDPLRSLLNLTGRWAKTLTSPVSGPAGIAQRAIQRKMTPGPVEASYFGPSSVVAPLGQLTQKKKDKRRTYK